MLCCSYTTQTTLATEPSVLAESVPSPVMRNGNETSCFLQQLMTVSNTSCSSVTDENVDNQQPPITMANSRGDTPLPLITSTVGPMLIYKNGPALSQSIADQMWSRIST